MTVWLIDTKTAAFVEAALVPIATEHVDQARIAWGNEFQRRQRLFHYDEDFLVWTQGIMSPSSLIAGSVPKGYVIICCDQIQGFIVFDEALQPSRRQPGTNLLYITYLATAPWNRRQGDETGLFRHVGRVLVAEAVRESVQLGCPGRIGLHSYWTASPFYEKLRFDDLGPDACRRGMSYFELRTGVAYELLSEFGRCEDSQSQLDSLCDYDAIQTRSSS
ncbi:MAG TPA: GNAT family N-acetyltransferase [Planctomycetaceae bacterium]